MNNIKETNYKRYCIRCGRELKTWKSMQKGFGPVCEKKYLEDVHKKQQVTIDNLLQKKGEKDGQ